MLGRPCTECGFDASACRVADVPELIRENSRTWGRLLGDGAVRAGRPDAATWSVLEYACHVRDVYGRYHGRIRLMGAEEDPLFPNWDQDRSAIADRYDEQDPAQVVAELEAAAEDLASLLERLDGPGWESPGRRSDGASFTVATIARYMIHDPVHHLWDVGRQG